MGANTMRSLCLLGALVVGLTTLPSPARAEETAEGKQIARLIAQLGSPQFTAREAATRALDAAGPRALEALRRALYHPETEVRCRAGRLVRAIEKRMETAHILAAKRVRLVYKD